MSAFFEFGPFEEEAARKQQSLTQAPCALRNELVALLESRGLTDADLARIRKITDVLLDLPLDRVYPNYVCHPIRIAGALALHRETPHPEETVLCLTHNALEIGALEHVRRWLSPRTLQAIVDLTVDRSQDRRSGYLVAYYDRLAIRDLLVLRAFDKLDNLLAFETHRVPDGELDVLRDLVCPRLPETEAGLRDYLLNAAARMDARATS